MGFDTVAEAMKAHRAALVVTARDISPKSQKETAYLAQKYKTELMQAPILMDEVDRILGKRAGILAVCDQGLAETLKRTINRADEEDNTLL